MKRTRRQRFIFLAAMIVCGASLSPARAGLFSISPDKEAGLGRQAAREIDGAARLSRGPVEEWVQRVGERLEAASKSEWKYTLRVIDSPEINAFALPGGYIYVHTGLRRVVKTDDELAAVLAHEITHAEEHHYAKQYAKASKRGAIFTIASIALGLPSAAGQALGVVDLAMTQKYSRVHELEADRIGMERMARAGFDPNAMISMLNAMAKETPKNDALGRWLSSHPDAAARIQAAQAENSKISQMQASGAAQVKPLFPRWQSISADNKEAQSAAP